MPEYYTFTPVWHGNIPEKAQVGSLPEPNAGSIPYFSAELSCGAGRFKNPAIIKIQTFYTFLHGVYS